MGTAILDTSILIKLRGNKLNTAVANIIATRLKGYELYVSEISCYEFLRSAQNKNDLDEKHKFLGQWPRLSVGTSLLKLATYYYNFILNMKNTSTGYQALNIRQISDCDIFIGATAIQFDAHICTTDGNDFPRPMFEELYVGKLPNNEKFYILKPDVSLFMSETEKFRSKVK